MGSLPRFIKELLSLLQNSWKSIISIIACTVLDDFHQYSIVREERSNSCNKEDRIHSKPSSDLLEVHNQILHAVAPKLVQSTLLGQGRPVKDVHVSQSLRISWALVLENDPQARRLRLSMLWEAEDFGV